MYDDNSYGPSSYSNYDFNNNGASNNYQTPPNNERPFPDTQPEKPKKKKGGNGTFKKIVLSCVYGVFFGLCAAGTLFGFYKFTEKFAPAPATVTTVDSTPTVEAQEINPTRVEVESLVESDITKVVEKVMPAMVSVSNKSTVQYRYWGRVYEQEQEGQGSGIIVGKNDTELLIVTNYHVIENADSLEIFFVDDKSYPADVKGTNQSMDLAVVAVKLSDMDTDTLNSITIADLGDSEALVLGEPVIAIGNALGYGQSVTNGIVSALNREIGDGEETSGKFIQTNAAINPGNSGGALLNYKGEVIGINSNKIGGSTIEGMGYAIPISSAKPIIEDLMSRNTKTKVASADDVGYIGIQPAEVFEGMPEGVYVAKVYEDTPAEACDIRTGDIITGIDGEKITCYADLQKALTYLPGGTTVEINIKRYGASGFEDVTVMITLGSRADIKTE